MGLGIGVDCSICGNQMYFDDDGYEIATQLEFINEKWAGVATCHDCIVAIKRMRIANNPKE